MQRCRRLQLTLFAVTLAFCSSCGRERVEAKVASGQRGVPCFVDASTGAPVAETDLPVDFGRVKVGSETRREVLIGNEGAATFTVSAIERSQELSSEFGFATAPFVVEPGGQHPLLITFRPTTFGEVVGSLRLVIEGGEPTQLTVELHGAGFQGDSPEVAVTPSVVEFGRVAVGATELRRVTLVNVGADVPNTIGDNLSFVAQEENGSWVQKAPEIVGDDGAHFGISWPPPGLGEAGLAEGESVELGVWFSPAAQGRFSATLVIYTNDPALPRYAVPLSGTGGAPAQCQYEIEPPSLNFGSVVSNTSLTLNLGITNVDPDPAHECELTSLDLTPVTTLVGAFALVNGPIVETTIASGRSLLIPVRFQPRSDGTYTGEIEFSISNPVRPQVRVSLTGIAQPGCALVAPRALEFGIIGDGCNSRQRLFTIYNACSSPLTVQRIERVAGSSEFEITKKPELPWALAGGASVDFGVTYHPVDPGADSAEVEVATSGGEPLRIPLTGTGIAVSPQTDVFGASPLPEYDILFVIDNSATMFDKQASLARNLRSIIDSFDQGYTDYHVAITTTDVTATGEAGWFVPTAGTNPTVITRTTPNGAALFAQNASVGTAGSETESLLRPAYLALSGALLTGHNAGFLRTSARLLVIVVSDAADQDPLQTSVADYADFLIGLKGMRRSDVTFAAVVPTATAAPSGCTYDTPTAGSDPRVSQLAQLTNGIVADICEADWGRHFQWRCSFCSPRNSFFLSNTPDMRGPNPIAITVGGQPCDPYDSSGNLRWSYNAASNAVEFAPASTPFEEVRITYKVACL